LHILILPSEFFITKENPTAGIFQFDQARVLVEKGHKVGVLALKPLFTFRDLLVYLKLIIRGKGSPIELLKRVRNAMLPRPFAFQSTRILNINVIRYIGSHRENSYRDAQQQKTLWDKNGLYAFNKYCKENGRPDILYAHNMIFAGMVGEYLSNIANIPLVLQEHSSQHIKGSMLDDLNQLSSHYFNKIKNIFAVSPSLGFQLEKKYKLNDGKIKWLPNVISPEYEEVIPKKMYSSEGVFTFLNVGSLIELKGQEELILAFDAAIKDEANLRLKIVGKGELDGKLRQLILDLGIQDKVELLGYLNRSEIIKLMNNCDVIVSSSHYETFGVVLIEALSLGKPVIATRCGGPECIVDNDNGVLIPSRDIEKMKLALLEMYSGIHRYDGVHIQKSLIGKFGKEAFYSRIEKICKKEISDHNN